MVAQTTISPFMILRSAPSKQMVLGKAITAGAKLVNQDKFEEQMRVVHVQGQDPQEDSKQMNESDVLNPLISKQIDFKKQD